MPTNREIIFRTVTPMLLGGANAVREGAERQPPVRQVRGPSVKGVLRFWWRAVHWSRFTREADGDVVLALRQMHRAEGELWGSASGEGGGQQSPVSLSVETWGLENEKLPPREVQRFRKGGRYLLGQGLDGGYHGTEVVKCRFCLKLRFHPRTTEQQEQEVLRTLRIFGLLGGLGARTRRGLGSVRLEEGLGPVALTRLALTQILKDELGELTAVAPPFPAFWEQSRVDLSLAKSDADKVLEAVGAKFQEYRKENFPDDSRAVGDFLRRPHPATLPRRASFGLPHHYYFKDSKQTVSIDPLEKTRKRRASPLWIHIHKLPGESESYVAIHTFMPCTFLPANDRIEIKGGGQSKEVDWCFYPEVIQGYLNSFKDRKRIL